MPLIKEVIQIKTVQGETVYLESEDVAALVLYFMESAKQAGKTLEEMFKE